MISPKNLLICLFYLAACTAPKKETTDDADSTVVEAPKSARYEPRSSEDGLTFNIDSSIESQELTIFGKSETIPYWVSKFYSQDHLTQNNNDIPNYSIKSVDLTEDEYSNAKGECVSRLILVVLRVLSGEEYYDIHFLTNDNDIYSEKVTYDGTIAQSTGSVSISTDYKLSEKCPVLAIMREYEGGDIDYGRMKEISFFVASETGMESVFDLVREYTLAKDYEVTGDESKNSASEIRDFEILKTKTNNFLDINVHTTRKKNGEVTEEKDALFRFDGEKYSEEREK